MVSNGHRVRHPHVRDPLVQREGVARGRQGGQLVEDLGPFRGNGEMLPVLPLDGHVEPEAPVRQLKGRVHRGVGVRVLRRRIHGRAEVVDARGLVVEGVRGHEVRCCRQDLVPLLERRGAGKRAVLRFRDVHRVRLLPDEQRVDLAWRRSPRRVRHLPPSRAFVALEPSAGPGRVEEIAVHVWETTP